MKIRNLSNPKWLAMASLLLLAMSVQAATVRDPRCEYLKDPLGIDAEKPRLSWVMDDGGQRSENKDPSTEVRGQKQSAYQVLVASTAELLAADKGDLWDSGKVVSDQSIHIEYQGKPLTLQMHCYWKVRVWDKEGKPSAWSPPARWSMGLLKPEDWKATWIGKDGGEENAGSEHRRLAGRMLRREFQAEKKIRRATAYVCGLGFFELFLNGGKISDHVMDPAISNYGKRVFYVTFDVTDQLRQGRNAVGVILGNSRFFAPRIKVPVDTPTFGYPKLLLQMRIDYEDGTVADIVSDESWKMTTKGPICSNNEFDGEEYDARLEQPGWDQAGFNDAVWEPVSLVKPPGGTLIAQMTEPIRVTEVLKPVAITSPTPSVYMIDFGQNLYGMVRIKVHGAAGTRVQLRTAYAKKPDGTLKMEDNRSALSTDVYTLKGQGEETWAPRFRGQGMHYAEVTGWPGVPTVENFEFIVVHTDMEKVGEFTCSNELLNKIYANVVRSMRLQNRSIPMEPDRDERQGWLGHPAKTSESEAYVFNVAPFYRSFLGEIRNDQGANGDLSSSGSFWSMAREDPVWPSVITILPDWYYHFYGDRSILQQNYDCMKRWMLFQTSVNLVPDGTSKWGGFGDWVDAATFEGGNPTNSVMLSTAYISHNCRIVARVAGMLGHAEDQKRFDALADQTAAAFQKKFFRPEVNKYEGETQCSYLVPLAFGLVPEDRRKAVEANFADDILVKHQGHLTVGLMGMQWFMQVLTDIGRPDVAFTVATQTTRPSWGYMIAKGGTSIWERWNYDTCDPGMNGESQMILAGNLGTWFYQTLGGINYDPMQPGFKHIILRPRPVGDLTFVRASHKCLYGVIRSEWKIEGGNFRWDVVIPSNTTATVYVPAKDAAGVSEGGKPAAQAEGVKFLRMEDGAAVYEVGAGQYKFVSTR